MPLTLTPARPQPVEAISIQHDGVELGTVEMRRAASDVQRWHACIHLDRLGGMLVSVSLAQGFGPDPAAAIADAIASGRAYVDAYARRLDAFARIVEAQ